MKKYPCPCCGYYTLPEEPPGTYFVCPVCYWEDDEVQFGEPDYSGGANSISLNDARQNFRAYGAIEESIRDAVRPPMEDEMSP